MIRRYPQRPTRRQHQDFHFFAAGDPIARVESQFHHNSQIAVASPPADPDSLPASAAPPTQPTALASGGAPAPVPVTPTAPVPPLKSGPPSTIDILVPPENVPALERQLGVRLRDHDDENEESDEDADAAERDIETIERIRAAVKLAPYEPPAIEQLQAAEQKRKQGSLSGKKRSASKAGARKSPQSLQSPKSNARLATPRRAPSHKARLPLASQARASHETQCTICTHRYRADIETEFMHWHTLGHIAYDYKVSRSAIYRHAYALGLFSQRNRLLRFSLGHLIERVQDVQPTADSIVRAVHLFARINDEGECVEPPAHVIVSSGGVRRESVAPSGHRPIAIQLDSPQLTGRVAQPPAEDGDQPNDIAPEDGTQEPPKSRGLQSAPRAGVVKGGTVNRPSHHATR
ncbi:MAG: hypothetical protein ACRD5K_15205 [Candidatus Acidiferrales bacterium]